MKRNEPCHCGSAEKYKNCCEAKDLRRSGGLTQIILIALIPLALGAVVWNLIHGDDEDAPVEAAVSTNAPLASTQPLSNPMGVPGSPQPEGPVPPGKVWSTDHGHWHDAAPVQIESSGVSDGLSATLGQASPAETPADGEVGPDGRIWSSAHNHWHDPEPETGGAAAGAPATTVPRSQIPRVVVNPDGSVSSTALTPQPEGEAPEGKVWSPEHGHWHDKPVFPSGTTEEDETPQR